MTESRQTSPVVNEPVRGSVPPPWFLALSGLERIEALAEGHIELPPLCRLMGIRPTHVGPGACTWIMPANECTTGLHGSLDLNALVDAAATGAATTALRPGQYVESLTSHFAGFRPTRVQPGNMLARARVINVSQFFVYAECGVEDSEGRAVAAATVCAGIREASTPPPPPPSELKPVDNPAYATPDPYERAYESTLPTLDEVRQHGFIKFLHKQSLGELKWPYSTLMGFRLQNVREGSHSVVIPASEWFCLFSRTVSSGVMSSFLNAGWFAAMSLRRPGTSFIPIARWDQYYGTVPADGRTMRLEAVAEFQTEDMFTNNSKLYDADDNLVALMSASGLAVDTAKRRKPIGPTAKRVLCTLLFTDIVNATKQAERLGDTAWRELLDEHHAKIRAEIARHQGTEIDTAGDGFFIRFDSPADAIDAAREIVRSVGTLGLEIRAGIHTGECEVLGRNLSGMAVHIAARIQGKAGPSEILVSSTVKDLVVGSDTAFTDRGEHELKGVSGAWSLHAVG